MEHPSVDWLCSVSGLPPDRSRFLLCMLSSFPLAIVFSKLLQAERVGSNIRHLFQLCVGLSFCVFCFKSQVWLLLLDTGVCYLLLVASPASLVHLSVFVWAIGFMSVSHLYRMYTDYNGYTLDFTGPSMIITMKVSSLACQIYDGLHRKDEELNTDQKKLAVKRIPSVIEYLSYMFNFTSILSGPAFNIVDYQKFIDGTDKISTDGKTVPSGVIPSLIKFVYAVFWISWTFVLPLTFEPFFDEEWRSSHGILYVSGYLLIVCFLVRCNYYFAWVLAESACNMSGFGFNGYNDSGTAQWDKVTNVVPHKTEVSSSLKLLVDNWNIGTANWLRRVAYERSIFSPTMMTYLLSATWHGFYPGYYGCFLSMGFFLITARKVRRFLRPHFLGSKGIKLFYDIITTIVSILLINYSCIQLCFLSAERVLDLYRYYYCAPHILCLLAYIFCPSPPRQKKE